MSNIVELSHDELNQVAGGCHAPKSQAPKATFEAVSGPDKNGKRTFRNFDDPKRLEEAKRLFGGT